MKTILKTALSYAVFGFAAGVYFREMTRFNDFDGMTALSVAHTHILLWGVAFLLLFGAIAHHLGHTLKEARVAWVLYHCGIGITVTGMLVKGTLQVVGTYASLSSGGVAAVAGISGIGHVLLAAGVIMMLLKLIAWAPDRS